MSTELVPANTDRLYPDLTPLQEAFAVEMVNRPGSAVAVAKRAGYSAASARELGPRCARNPAIIRAIYELTVKQLGLATPAALARIIKLSTKAKSEYVQLEASKDLLDRAGMAAPKRVQVSGGVSVTIDLSE